MKPWPFLHGPSHRPPRFKRWFACAPASMVYPQSRSASYLGLSPALCPTAALTTKPPSVQSPFAHCWRYLHWGDVTRLLGRHYSSLLAPTDSCADPIWLSPTSASASLGKPLQVATSPCCHRDLPDVSSANLSSDAWSPATAGPQSACTCFFLRAIGLPQQRRGSACPLLTREHDFPRSVFSRLQTFLNVPASEFAHLPDRSHPGASCRRATEAVTSEQNMLGYLRMHRIC